MSFFPSDWSSFLWGGAIGAIAAFGTGFLKKAGEKTFAHFENKMNPKAPEPIQLDGRFVPSVYPPGECAWINEVKLYEYEEKGYGYYPHPKNDARCYRITSDGRHSIKEYLMHQPEAKRQSDA